MLRKKIVQESEIIHHSKIYPPRNGTGKENKMLKQRSIHEKIMRANFTGAERNIPIRNDP